MKHIKTKKVWLLFLMLCGLILVSKSNVFANPSFGYVVVRCTGTLAVEVLSTNATAWFVVAGSTSQALSAGQSAVSITSITVRNISNGLLCRWAVYVSSIQRTTDGSTWLSDEGVGAWSLSTSTSPNIAVAVLYSVFATSRPSITQFEIEDILNHYPNPSSSDLNNNATYEIQPARFNPRGSNFYNTDYSLGANVNAIAPVGSPGSPVRSMFFRIDTPTAILDQYPRRFVIAVRANPAAEGF